MFLFSRFVRNAFAVVCAALPVATVAQVYSASRPEVRVLNKVDSAVRATLPGNVPASVATATIGSRLNGATQLNHVMLMLKPSDDQVAALHTMLDAQQDKNSPLFHKWLTPDTFAQSFGVADADVLKVTSWLQDSGFAIEQVSRSKRVIQFSGSVSAVESAFTTEIHNVTINGEAHISNTSEISVPAALAPVVQGLVRLNDMLPKTDAHLVGTVLQQRAAEAAQNGGVAPEYGVATGTHYVTPGDVSTIFNATPLLNASSPIDGTGVTIAVLARSNIDLGDVAAFRAMFGLPVKNPTVTVVGTDPGKNGDDTEAYLDAEWAGAIAPNANINFIVSSASLISGGTDTSALYAVDNNIGDIISLSYGGCEANFTASGTAFWNVLWEQAAAQGQTAMVSSGDSGAAGCDSSSATYATHGYGVNALGVSAYNVSVGGSMFVDYGSSQYWGATGGTTIPFANALSYMPEAALNQGRLTSTLLNSGSTGTSAGTGIFSGGGGISLFTARPSWQTGSGISATADPTDYNGAAVTLTGTTVTGPHRLSPDVSLISANGHVGTLFCAGGICRTTSAGGLGNAGIVGGTSVATPVMASAQALINQKNGGRQGNANVYYYKLANNQYTASTTACQATNGTAASPTVTLPAATCNFHDIVAGNIVVPTAATGTAGIGYAAGPGYDAATGLGSVNIANVANNWSTVTFNATGTTLNLTPTSGITHGANQMATIQVTPASGSGTPTGDVSIIASTASTANGYSSPQVLTLSGGSVTATLNSLPAGTYSVYAHYAGDTTFASSNSAPVTVTIAKESSTTNLTGYSVLTSGAINPTSSFPYATNLIYLDTEITSPSGHGTASGSVTFNINRNGSPLPSLITTLDTYGTTYLQSGAGISTFYLLPNYTTLIPGNYSVTANYAGDSNFNSSTATTAFTVTQATPVATLTTPTAQITSGQLATLTFTVTPPTTAAAAATGTVTFVDTTTNTTLGSAALSNSTVSISTNLITASGANTISASYGGDTNYATGSATTAITVGTGTGPTVSVAASGTLTVGASVTLTATLSSAPSASSTVSFYDGTVLLGSAATTTTTAAIPVTRFTAGAHSITVFFGGNASQASSTSTVTVVTIAKNTTGVNITAGPVTQNYGGVALSGSITRSPSSTAAPVVPLTGTVSINDTSTTPATVLGSATPAFDPSGYGTYAFNFSSGALAPGTHSLQAVYSGDANYNGSTSANTPTFTVAKGVPTVSAIPGSTVYGTATSALTGMLAFGGATAPTGAVTIGIDGGVPVAATCTGTSSPLTCVVSSYNTSTISAGAHTITVTYAGDTNYNSATGTAPFTVTKATAAITFTVPNHTYGDAPFTVSASSASTGTFTYSVVSGPATISSGTVTLTGAGTVVLLASQAADANYVANTKQATFTVALGTAAITFTVPNHTYGDAPFTVSASSASTGAFTYSVVSGPATITNNTVTLTGAGTVVLQASQAADSNYAANSKQATFSVAFLATTTAVTASPNPSTSGVAVSFTATVTAGTNPVSLGSVVFSEGSTVLGTVALANGQAVYTTSALSVASHTIVATYQGTTGYSGSNGSVMEVVNPATFALTDNGAKSLSLTLLSGTSAITTIAATPTPTFAGSVTFTCTNLPTNVACNFSNSTLTFSGNGVAQTTTLRISSFAQTASIKSSAETRLTLSLVFPGLLLVGLGASRRKRLAVRHLVMMSFVLLGLAATASLTGCGSSSSLHNAPTGTYTINVVATSGTITQTLPVTLTIQ